MTDTTRFFGRLGIVMALLGGMLASSPLLHGQTVDKHVRVGVPSDWAHQHVLFPHSQNLSANLRAQKDIRAVHEAYLRHPEIWWPSAQRNLAKAGKEKRDWSFPLGTTTFEPIIDFTFTIGSQSGFGSMNVADQLNGSYLAYSGSLTVNRIFDIGTYSLFPGGPGVTTSPSGAFIYDNLIYPNYPTTNPAIDLDGILFRNAAGFEINLWGNGPNAYEYDDTGYAHDNTGNPLTVNFDPGGGQTYPAKYVFDVTSTPSCTLDFVATGLPSNAVSGGQANIIGVNNLYSNPGGTGYCPGTAPGVAFAYASGTGQVPSAVSISQFGNWLAYVENRQNGSSYFHVLALGTTGNNGTSATAAAVPGVGNNAIDASVLLSPDGGTTLESSTTAPYIVYTSADSADVAYVTTYSSRNTSTGYVYKISNLFDGGTPTPTIVWSALVNALPSAPVYDSVSNNVYFTDSQGRIDYITDTGAAPTVTYGPVVAPGTTSENPVVVDSTNEMIYASFNSNGTNAVVVQAPTSLATTITVPVGAATTAFSGPYGPQFNNAFFTGTGTQEMYIAGTGTSGTTPTLYGIGFVGANLDPTTVVNAPLATGMADSSPVTEFYNAALNKDLLFVGVTNNCIATTLGGTAGCVVSLDITAGFPTVGAGSTALAAPGGTTGISVDNDSPLSQASSIYYGTKSGSTLVKATQVGLN
jgi:hypothetical protein